MPAKTHLNNLVPSGRDDDGVRGVGAESDTADPLGVAVLGDVELALSEGVPQLDGAVTRRGNNLPVVGREGDGKDVTGVADEATGGGTGVEVVQSEGLVPRRGQSELAVGGKSNVGDEVRVTSEDLLGVSVLSVLTGEGPDDQGLVTRTTDEHVRVLRRGGNAGDPALVGGERASVDERVRHVV